MREERRVLYLLKQLMANFKYLLVILWAGVSAIAQVSTANVAGVVEDSTDARIPGASIKLINSQTGTENGATTNDLGFFVLAGVIPGNYVLQIERDGFATTQFTEITLNIGDSKQFLIRMKVGAVDQTVMVDASGMTLGATDASVTTVVDRKFVMNVPLNGRSFQDLISMTPGIATQSPQAFGQFGESRGDFSINGQRPDANSFTIDGVSGDIGTGLPFGHRTIASTGKYAGNTALGTTQGLVSLDALQEFRVLNSSSSAEYGRTPGGQFTLLTRSGGNALHGSVYNYSRVSVLDANDWFTSYNLPSAGESLDSLLRVGWSFHQQDFGGTLSGPITLHKIYQGRDKTFFFVSYEGLLVSQPTAPLVQYVPDSLLHQEVPPPLKPVIDAFPNPTAPLTPEPTGLAPFIFGAYPSPGRVDSTSIRFDHNFSQKISSFFRFGDTPSDSQTRNISSVSTTGMKTLTLTFGTAAQLSATKSDDFRLGFARSSSQLHTVIGYNGAFDFLGGGLTNLNGDMGVPSSYGSASSEVYIRIPDIGESFINTDNASSSIRQWNIRNTFNFQAAHHLFRFGFDQRNIVSPITPPAVSLEADFFDRASMVNNLSSDLVITKNEPATPIFNEFSAFAQDDWRIAKALSLSLGLRWEVDPPPGEAHGKNAYTLLGDIESPATLRLAPRGTPLWHTSWYNLAPRLGMAWVANDKPGGELIVRAGGGVFFDTANGPAASAFNAVGFSKASHLYNAPLPAAASEFDFGDPTTPPYTDTTAFVFPFHFQLPYTLQWNVALEKALGNRQAFTLSYVGADSRRLIQAQRRNVNRENPEFSEVYFFPNGISSNYQSLQAKLQRSVSPGLQVLASYTWSHTLDFGSTDSAYSLTYGNSDLDLRHNLQAAVSWDEQQLSGGWVWENLLSGWGADGRLFARTAFPVTPLGNLFLDSVTGDRYYSGVDLIRDRPFYLNGSQYPGGRRFNGGPGAIDPAFALPTGANAGTLPRNMIRGFGAWEANVAVRKDIHVYGPLNVQIRAEAFNIFNHPDLGYVDPHLTDELFGQSTLMLNQSFGASGSLYQQGGPRSAQIMLKLAF